MEKPKDHLEWMYKGAGGQVNPEDYLLGKEVDQNILNTKSEPPVPQPAVVPDKPASFAVNAKDMARKMREDPLFAIKKRELNNRKELVSNPIRMKQLQQMLQHQVGKGRKKSKKHKKKSKKHKKQTSSDTSESEDEPTTRRGRHKITQHKSERHDHDRQEKRHRPSTRDEGHLHQGKLATLDQARMKELLQKEMLQKRGESPDSSSSSTSSSSKSDSEDDRRGGRQQQGHAKRYPEDDKRQRNSGEQRTSNRQRERKESPPLRRKHSGDNNNAERRTSHHSQRTSRRGTHSPSPNKQYLNKSGHQTNRRGGSYVRDEKRRRSFSPDVEHAHRYKDRQGESYTGERRNRSRSPIPRPNSRVTESDRRDNSPQRSSADMKRKLKEDEMDQKRAEMMENAKWRDDQRMERVKTYEKEERAQAEAEKRKAKHAEFVQPLKLADNSSVEDRIHRNIHSLQRTRAALDKNFTKR